MSVNGKMKNLMVLDKFIFQMALTMKGLSPMVLSTGKADLFLKEVVFIKDKLGIMLQKEKEY